MAARIAAVEGVDALVVGCADLAAETGESLAAGAPRVRDAITRVRDATEAAGVSFGLAGPVDPDLLSELADVPPDIAVLGADVRIYARALAERFEAARELARAGPREDIHVCA